MPVQVVMEQLRTSHAGLIQEEAAERLTSKGANLLSTKKPPTWWQLLLAILPNPFNILLGLLAIISVATPHPQWSTFIILVVMILISCVVRFWQEYRSTVAAMKLQEGVRTNIRVRRTLSGVDTIDMTIDEKALVPGDLLLVDPGDSVPADCMVLESSNLQVSQSSLTGESDTVRKSGYTQGEMGDGSLFELEHILFAGTSVISGSGLAIVLMTGDDVFIASITKQINERRPMNAFERGIRNVSYMMIGFMLVMVSVVLAVRGNVTRDWGQAALFSISVAVGLVPEMLPAVVNVNLARGAFTLSKKKAIVKRLDSIQNLGGMSVLCSDKTGTLTKDEIALCHHVNTFGIQKNKIFELAYVNAVNQSGRKNNIDAAILKHTKRDQKNINIGQKVAEIPFDFETRRSSAIVRTPSGNLLLVCKGAFEEVSSICTHIRFGTKAVALAAEHRQSLIKQAADFNADGYRVVLVATRQVQDYELDDSDHREGLDTNLTVEGLLTFLDPLKEDAKTSIHRLQELGVDFRVLTGDNLAVALKVCRTLDIARPVSEDEMQAITGPDLARLAGEDFDRAVKMCKVFAKLTPSQKGQVIMSLKAQGEVVGMLGDGINDCVALRLADAGISVDSGMNVAKNCADIILTQKELSIIVDCVVTGRITHGNT
jgi:P-type Mg2+ transporter